MAAVAVAAVAVAAVACLGGNGENGENDETGKGQTRPAVRGRALRVGSCEYFVAKL